MWTRKELKEKGKKGFYNNYWKAVVVGLILSIALGVGNAPNVDFHFPGQGESLEQKVDNLGDAMDALGEDFEGELHHDLEEAHGDMEEAHEDLAEAREDLEEARVILGEITSKLQEHKGVTIAASLLLALIALVVSIFGFALKAFLLNPLAVGGQKYFVEALDGTPEIKVVGSSFNKSYLGTVKTMFFKDLYRFLWSLLFVVPGIIKGYEYRMIPYLIAENPDMTTKEAFDRSREMMKGNKMDAFVLDLSFVGWHILNAVTCGILGLFFLHPYQYSTNAALYERLLGDVAVEQNTEYYTEIQ